MRLNGNYIKTYRKESIKAAEQLGYDASVIEKIKKASTEYEITRILTEARNKTIFEGDKNYENIL